jgi:predicted permease
LQDLRAGTLDAEEAHMDSFLLDVRAALRQLARQKAFAAVVIVTLALAIGVNSLVFSFVSFFVLRPLPMKDVPRLVMIFATHPEHARSRALVSYGDFHDWAGEARSFEDLAAGANRTLALTGAGDPLRVRAFAVTASLFRAWGLGTVAGRVIGADDDRKGAPRVALLSHGFWSRRFGADPAVVGQTLRLDGQPHLVVGVVTPDIEIGTLSEVDVWTPLTADADPSDRVGRSLIVTGRLKQGITPLQAAAEIRALSERQQRDHPATNAGWSAQVLPFRSAMTNAESWILLALLQLTVTVVLAIACANLANLTLARGWARQRETAVRSALGAGRGRIVRQLLTEGLVLSVAGGALGVLLAAWGLDLIRSVTFEPFFALVVLDRRVMAYSALISLATPLLFGLWPALRTTSVDLVTALKEGGAAAGASPRRVRARNLLVSAQLALALALLLVAGLVLRAALALQGLHVGFDARDLVTLKTDLPAARYPDDARIRAFGSRLEERLRAIPGVTGVAVAAGRPVFEPGASEPLVVEGTNAPSESARPFALRTAVGAGYFATLRVPIKEGRPLDARDRPGAEPTVVVNEALATRHFSGSSPIGRRLRIGAGDVAWRTVVGVAGNVLNAEPGRPHLPQAFVPFDQEPARTMVVLVRTSRTDAIVSAARRELAELDPEQPLYDVKTMEQAFFEALASDRVVTGMFFVFACVALGLATVGLYSLISYLVSQRTREIGVRVALGANRTDVVRMVLGQGTRLLGTGLGVGWLMGLGLGQAMAGALAEVSPSDPLTFTLVPVLLAVVGLAATAVPARRAARVDPATVLRAE